MPKIINNIVRGVQTTVYLVCRPNQAALPVAGYASIMNEVKNNPATPGNYMLLPGANATVNAANWVEASTSSNLCLDQQAAGNADISIWQD